MALSMCRVCLVGNSKMVDIDNIYLREMYEKLTNSVLNAEAGNRMPGTICYVCHRQLQKCYMFSNMAQKSNRILRELLHDTDEESHPSLISLSQEIIHHLVVTPTQHMSFNICSNTASISPITVKEEQVAVKLENADEYTNDEALEDDEKSNDSNNMQTSQEIYINVETSSMSPCFYCDVCYKKLSNKCLMVEHLKSHMQIHTKEQPYSCNWCDKAFTKKNYLREHIRVHTGEKLYSCDRCDKVFHRKSSLSNHMRVHSGENPFSCNMCDKAFTRNSFLTRHMRVHTSERAYSCYRCNKAFIWKSNLSEHMRVHTGEKPFSCNRCEKVFSHKSSLSAHMRVHTGDKPFSCHRCDKAFSKKSNLSTHMRVHTGDKPFSCNRCEKVFSQKSSLSAHMRVHTGDKPFSCDRCDKVFTTKRFLTKHMLTKHTEEPESRNSLA